MLLNLPKPTGNKTGWPWTKETPQETYQEGQIYPKISVIIPSYNHGAFIEEAIRSILLQNYPNLELIIMDGGSTDNTPEILEKYDVWISIWESRKDKGQSDAMNKGWRRASGDIIAFINSDDYYEPGVFARVGRYFSSASGPDMLMGHTRLIRKDGTEIKVKTPCTRYYQLAVLGGRYPMPNNPVGYFYDKKIQEAAGDFDVNDHYSMDYRFLLRAFRAARNITTIKTVFGNYRYDDNSKTFNNAQSADGAKIRQKLQQMAREESAPFGERFVKLLQQSHELTNKKLALPNRLGIKKIFQPGIDRKLDKIDEQLKVIEDSNREIV